MRSLSALMLAVLLLTAGCGSEDATSTTTATTPPAADATEPAAQEPAETQAAAPAEESEPAEAQPTDEPADQPADAAAATVVLEPLALGFADESGSITRLEFDQADQQTTTTALTAALGEPTSQQEALECGPGALDAVNWDGLTAFFHDGVFAGWYVQEPTPTTLTTATGIGLGAKLGDVRAAYGDVTVEETTIGFEFAAGDIFGTLTADSDHDTVVTMWSGANCIAR